jgi:hypothetical protein
MSAQDTLARIIQREAEKLDKLSLVGPAPLEPSLLAVLEVLSRCAKALPPAPVEPKEQDDEPEDPAELLRRVGQA